MKKYLIRLADHLDKKGFKREADYIDLVLKKHAELEEYENMTLEELKKLKADIESMPEEDFEIMMSATNNKYNKILSAIQSKESGDVDLKEQEEQRESDGFEEARQYAGEKFDLLSADEIFRNIDLDEIEVEGLSDAKDIPYDIRADMVFEAIESLIKERQTDSEIINHIQNFLAFLVFEEGATSFVARDAIDKGWIVESEKDPGYYKIFSYEM
jgi:hypothetical protein